MLTLLSSLGVSESILSAVRRRGTTDKVILYGGVVCILLLVFLLYRWSHGGIVSAPATP
jgi:hypothetical protein